MRNYYATVLLTFILAGTLLSGFFIQPDDSQAFPGRNWQAQYYATTDLSGDPVYSTIEESISFNWVFEAPYPAVPTDGFSARWTSNPTFEAGVYRFRAGADDGIRLRIDDKPVIDEFTEGGFRTFTRDVQLSAGRHRITVEYFDLVDQAGVLVEWSFLNPVADSPPTQADAARTAEAAPQVFVHVTTGELNVYAEPNINSDRIGRVYLYQRYPILGISADGAWYLITLSDDLHGWIGSQYAGLDDDAEIPVVGATPEAPDATPVVSITGKTTDELAIRDVPQGIKIEVMPPDTEMQILGRNASGTWFYVKWQDLEGWSFATYILVTNGHVADLPIISVE